MLLGAIFGGVCCGLRRSGAFATPTLFDICSYIEGQDLRIGKLFHTSICHQVRCPYCCDRSIPHHGRPEFVWWPRLHQSRIRQRCVAKTCSAWNTGRIQAGFAELKIVHASLTPEVVKAHDADEQVDANRDPCLPIEFYTKCQPVSIKRIYVSARWWAKQKTVRMVSGMWRPWEAKNWCSTRPWCLCKAGASEMEVTKHGSVSMEDTSGAPRTCGMTWLWACEENNTKRQQRITPSESMSTASHMCHTHWWRMSAASVFLNWMR